MRKLPLIALVLLAACNQQSGGAENAETRTDAPQAESSAPADAAAPAKAPAAKPDFSAMAKGAALSVNRDAECFKTGPSADPDIPLNFGAGVAVQFDSLQGDKVQVVAEGATCVIAADALSLSQ